MRRASLPFRSKPKSTRRRRALTPPFPSDFRPRPSYFLQAQCPLLFDLPYEIRLQIYSELWGEGFIRVEEVEDWGEGKTKRKKKKKSKRKKFFGGDEQEEEQVEDGVIDMRPLLGLLLTCRLVYMELLPVLMARPIVMPSLATIHHHLYRIPPKHFNYITSLTLTIQLPYLLFPVRQLPASNTWIGRTIKQLQHFDVPLWNLVWYGLAGGSPEGAKSGGSGQIYSGGSASAAASSGESLRRGSTTTGQGLTCLRFFHVSIAARDYTTLNPEWPSVPEDIVATLLWEPVLTFARARGWPQRRPQLQTRRSTKRTYSVVDTKSADAAADDDGAGSFPQWTMYVSWDVALENDGRGGPPDRLLRGPEEKKAGLPFVLRRIKVTPESNAPPGGVDFATGRNPGRVSDSSSSSEEDDSGEENDNGEEDEGYRSGAGVDGTQSSGQGVAQRERQWWER